MSVGPHFKQQSLKENAVASQIIKKLRETIDLKRKGKNEMIISNLKNKDETKIRNCNPFRKTENLKRNAISLSPKKNKEYDEACMLPPNKKNPDMKTLVIDLDETLVHSTFDQVDNSDLIVPLVIEGETYEIYVLIRPGAYEFIEELSKCFEIVVFTASIAKYADPVITKLDVNKRCNYRLFREHCTYMDGAYVKDMSKMGRNLRNIVILDNSPLSYNLQEHNGIPVKSWFDDTRDRELFRLLPILKNLSGFYDVRTEIPKFIVNNTLIWTRAMKWLEENCVMMNYKDDLIISDLNSSIHSFNNEYSNKQTIVYNYSEGTDKFKQGNSGNPNPPINKNAKGSLQAFNNSSLRINKPNININIINGSLNNIVLTGQNSPIKEESSSYRVANTEDNVNTRSPSNHIFSDLKNCKSALNNRFTNLNKRVNLHYFSKRNKDQIKIEDHSCSREKESEEEECMRRVHTTANEETTDPFKTKPGFKSFFPTRNTSFYHKKNCDSTYLFNLKENKLNLFKIKTNYSKFVKNYNLDKLKYTTNSNVSNCNASYSVNMSKTNLINENAYKKNNSVNKNPIRLNEKSNSKANLNTPTSQNMKTRNLYFKSKINKSDVGSYLLDNKSLLIKLNSQSGQINFIKANKLKEKDGSLLIEKGKNSFTNSTVNSPKIEVVKQRYNKGGLFEHIKYKSNYLISTNKKFGKLDKHNSKTDINSKIDLRSSYENSNIYLQTSTSVSRRDNDNLNELTSSMYINKPVIFNNLENKKIKNQSFSRELTNNYVKAKVLNMKTPPKKIKENIIKMHKDNERKL